MINQIRKTGNKCSSCGKGILRGRRVTFSGKRNKRIFRPNLHTVWFKNGNRRMRIKLCTKCLRQYKTETSQAAT